jgi:hypothetical protein
MLATLNLIKMSKNKTANKRSLADQTADYMNMSFNYQNTYGVEITRRIGDDMFMFVYRGKCYSAFHKEDKLNKKSIRIETEHGD